MESRKPSSSEPRHTPLDTRLTKARCKQRASSLESRPEDWKVFQKPVLPIRLFDQVHRNPPPRQDRADNPEVCRSFHSRSNTRPVREKAAGNRGADGETRKDGAED